MKINSTFLSRTFLSLTALLLAVNLGGQTVFEDDFSTAHDYVADSTTATGWDGYLLNSGVNATQDGDVLKMNTTEVTGSLYIEASNTDFENNEDDGVFLFKTVAADENFDVRVMIGPHTDFPTLEGLVYYNAGGLMVKHPVADSVDFFNTLAFDHPEWGCVHLNKNVNGGAQTDICRNYADSINVNPWLRMTKRGPVFTSYFGADGENWTELRTVIRLDLLGTDLLVGIVQCTYSADTANVEFDNFKLITNPMSDTYEGFDVAHDYVADSTTGTFWDGYLLNSGVNATQDGDLLKMNTTEVTGSLYIEASNTDWENSEDDGLFLFKNVAADQDFDMMVMIGPHSDFPSLEDNVYYNAGGLQVKNPVADSVDFFNFTAFDHPEWGVVHLHKIVDGGSQTERFTTAADSIEANPWLRMTKSGPAFTTYYSANGQDWRFFMMSLGF